MFLIDESLVVNSSVELVACRCMCVRDTSVTFKH